jgi:hypothetical protein
VILLLSCGGRTGSPIKDRENDSQAAPLVDTPRSFVKNYGALDSNRLFAFVGEKLSVEPLPETQGSMNYSFKAKYVILEKIYGDFTQDTIEFVAYDHYGIPAFSKFKNVLLFVSADSGTYYHEKYMYNDVYKTKDGRWAGAYSRDYEHAYNKHTKIKPIKIDFVERVVYPVKVMDDRGNQLRYSYPQPYFRIVGDSAIPIYGNYVDDLFTLKKEGVLTARELFDPTPEQEDDMVESMQPEPPKTPPSADDLKFLAFWKTFVKSVKEPGLNNFRSIALDTLMICDKPQATDTFIDKCFAEVIDDEVQKRIVDRTKLEYTSDEVAFANIFTSNARKEIVKKGNGYRFRQMLVTRSSRNNKPPSIVFDFIETKKGYRLYGINQ